MQEPNLQDVHDALWSLIEPGATIQAIGRQRTLHQLGYVVAAVTENGLRTVTVDQAAGCFRELLIEATAQLEDRPDSPDPPNDARAAQELLGLRPGLSTRTPAARRARCADWLATSVAAAADRRGGKPSRYEKLVGSLAEVVFSAESHYQLEQIRQALREHRRPSESLLSVNWVDRFESYYRIWTPIARFEWDAVTALVALRDERLDRFRRNAYEALFNFARYRVALGGFVAERGGLWLLPSVLDEQPIADAVWKIAAAAPFIRLEEARLRAAATSDDLVAFSAWLESEGQDLSDRWTAWLESCPCRRVRHHGRKSCNVHKAIRQARVYVEGINRQWDEIADWYRIERPASDIGPQGDADWQVAPGISDR
jgi:hypothetical protein